VLRNADVEAIFDELERLAGGDTAVPAIRMVDLRGEPVSTGITFPSPLEMSLSSR
jgi:hypothetical protein